MDFGHPDLACETQTVRRAAAILSDIVHAIEGFVPSGVEDCDVPVHLSGLYEAAILPRGPRAGHPVPLPLLRGHSGTWSSRASRPERPGTCCPLLACGFITVRSRTIGPRGQRDPKVPQWHEPLRIGREGRSSTAVLHSITWIIAQCPVGAGQHQSSSPAPRYRRPRPSFVPDSPPRPSPVLLIVR